MSMPRRPAAHRLNDERRVRSQVQPPPMPAFPRPPEADTAPVPPVPPVDDPGTPIADELMFGPSAYRYHPDTTQTLPPVGYSPVPDAVYPPEHSVTAQPRNETVVDDDVPDDEPFSAQLARARRQTAASTRTRSEGQITTECLEWLNAQPLAFARKVHQAAMSGGGEPDIDACLSGRSVKIEMKRPGETPTERQMRRMQRWQQAGAVVGWATSLDEVKAIVAMVHDARYQNPLTGPGAPRP